MPKVCKQGRDDAIVSHPTSSYMLCFLFWLLVLISFEVTTVTSMDSQEPTCCDDGHLLAS